MTTPTIAERISYGTPIDERADPLAPVALVPRATTALVGRILLAAIFIVSGLAKLTDPAGAVGYMENMGISNAYPLAIIAGLAELCGGIALATGFLGRLAALGLIAVLIPTTLIFHGFWRFEGEMAKMNMVQFMKNLAIMGGLALLAAHGPGRYSIDARLRRPLSP